MSDHRSRLRQFLQSVPPEAITDTDTLIPLLTDAWPEFIDSDQCGMKSNKLGRIENVRWNRPHLEFTIERHGGTMLGSSRADLQDWEINVTEGTARVFTAGYRQLHPRQPPLDVEPLVERVLTAITGQDDQCLERLPNGSVRVHVGVLIPATSTAKQTVQGRRKRFWRALEKTTRDRGLVPGARPPHVRTSIG